MLSYFSSTIREVLKDLGLVAGHKRISGTSVGGRVKILDYGYIFVGRGPYHIYSAVSNTRVGLNSLVGGGFPKHLKNGEVRKFPQMSKQGLPEEIE